MFLSLFLPSSGGPYQTCALGPNGPGRLHRGTWPCDRSPWGVLGYGHSGPPSRRPLPGFAVAVLCSALVGGDGDAAARPVGLLGLSPPRAAVLRFPCLRLTSTQPLTPCPRFPRFTLRPLLWFAPPPNMLGAPAVVPAAACGRLARGSLLAAGFGTVLASAQQSSSPL